MIPETQMQTVSLLDYFAAKEATQPPNEFWAAECPPSPLMGKNGKPMPIPMPEPAQVAAVVAKWRFVMADAMVAESKKRSE